MRTRPCVLAEGDKGLSPGVCVSASLCLAVGLRQKAPNVAEAGGDTLREGRALGGPFPKTPPSPHHHRVSFLSPSQ